MNAGFHILFLVSRRDALTPVSDVRASCYAITDEIERQLPLVSFPGECQTNKDRIGEIGLC
jgi:hypothetical protein